MRQDEADALDRELGTSNTEQALQAERKANEVLTSEISQDAARLGRIKEALDEMNADDLWDRRNAMVDHIVDNGFLRENQEIMYKSDFMKAISELRNILIG